MSDNPVALPDFTRWPSFPFEGDMRVKQLAAPVDVEPPRSGEGGTGCVACGTPEDAYIWVDERWRVRAMDRPTGLPMVLILECRSHLDLGDLSNLLAAELGVMTVRLERAIRSLDGVARVHVNRWGDGSAHLHLWFLARPYGRLQLRGTFLSLWDDILPVIPEQQWRENLALIAAWLADFGGQALAEPPHIEWQSPSTFASSPGPSTDSSSAPVVGVDSSSHDGSADHVDPRTKATPGMGTGESAPSSDETAAEEDPSFGRNGGHQHAGVDRGYGLAPPDSAHAGHDSGAGARHGGAASGGPGSRPADDVSLSESGREGAGADSDVPSQVGANAVSLPPGEVAGGDIGAPVPRPRTAAD